ncbi:pyrimidine reductase family protein [Streptomyces sp. HNM0574]|uniref:pyrimidine reductase family protein n=1 Tax=Streptomyces sp. HNM0574 TaxID=2714954 RepID=UPI00146D7755|nr:pyrimidine reductase family protein [Streptomyces sp. HNM0574]NLU65842.1 pyrimidine reductase family protein [Streptomyces sp. HNM0574]
MRRLFPSTTSVTKAPASGGTVTESPQGQWSLESLMDAYAYPEAPTGPGGSWLRANMVASLDGAAHHEGRSQPLSCEADMRIFGVLRGLADAVVVGAQTVRQEGYRPARRREAFEERRAAAGQGPAPAIAVVSAGLELDFGLPLFTEPLVPTLLVTGAAAPQQGLAEARRRGVEVVFAGDGAAVDPGRVAGALAERGLRRLLTEGGPRMLGQFTEADALDELCLTISPRITAGDAPRIVNGWGHTVPADFSLEGLLEENGFLFTRYSRVRQ